MNSSEMISVMPDELLKAQTVAARNTLFATIGKHYHAGLCQMGATMKAYKGVGYREILTHYYPHYPNTTVAALGAGVPEARAE